MRSTITAALVFVLAIGCGGKKNGGGDDDDTVDACIGIECDVVNCSAMGLPTTSITGTVFAPNGTLPLNGVNVYVPRDALPPFTEGVTCDRCATTLPGAPIVQTVSDAKGQFRLDNVPAGANIPLVITTGKWRRVVQIATVNQCTDNAVGAADTRLPKNKSEGDIPRIAITTGDADTMECLVRKLGVDDAEIGKTGDDRRIHLYTGDGVASFNAGFPGGSGAIPSATTFWNSVDTLSFYDITILSCEGAQLDSPKTQTDLDAMKAYADKGGRVFASHWHNIWISGNFEDNNPGLAPAVWKDLVSWNDRGNFDGSVTIDEVLNPKGTLFADWMVNVGASPTMRGLFDVNQGRTTADAIVNGGVERWVVRQDHPQMFQFTTPVEAAQDQKCGKVVFTDMHVSGTPANLNPYPTHCVGGTDLTAQEKALAFMFFDIASCVGGIF